MMKQHKGKLLISSLLILLPSLLGLILWDKLPEQIAIHWGLDGNADAWGKPVLFLLLLPLFLLALHWLGLWLTALDHRKKPQSTKVYGMVFWIMPFISLYVLAVLYATAFGYTFNFMMVTGFLFGVLFLIIGNYLPKCRPNRTIGIRIIWTLISEENWIATHRFAGKVTVICGLLCCVISFLPVSWFFLAFLLVVLGMVLTVSIYSYGYYRKQRREGRLKSAEYPEKARDQKTARISLVVSLLILAGAAVVCFTGNVTTTVGETSFTVDATYSEALTVEYADIEAIEYHAEGISGTRVSGFGTPRLLLGWFQNEELGSYTRYTYAGDTPCILLTVKGNALVIGGTDEAETKALYDALVARWEAVKQN
jgi:uncharacterized membrane protein